ncbi:MAG: DUF1538 domain-containing protein [Clostridiales bacterium]|nr:DUF1538 domain-containing protein [Clostridiales bacterium]
MEKIKESLSSVLPITIIVLILCFSIAPIPGSTLMAFTIGAIFLIVGMGTFTLGAEMSMTPIGEKVGAFMTKSRKLWVVILVSFILGVGITVSEPDLQVLATQVPTIPNGILIGAVALGVGIALVVGLLRILFRIRLSYILIVCYIIVFILAAFVSPEFWAIAFDSGGVTTGPMTVPFIMAFGVGVAFIRSDRHANNDSFGLVALGSVGPIMAVMILGLVFAPEGGAYTPVEIPNVADTKELWGLFSHALPHYCKEVAIALAPIVGFFLVFQVFFLRIPKNQMIKIVVGLVYTYVGLVLFLTGVNVGFMPVGNYIGKLIAELPYNWILIPIGALIGYFIVSAEPAVHVLNKQVEELTSGAIPYKAMNTCLSIGVAGALALSMVRVLTGISIMYFLIPGYVIALALTFFVPKIFSSIAFDSGGVASGPMTATFLLPLAMGVADGVGGNVVTDAFGVVSMVAMMPLIIVQIMGLVYKIKQGKAAAQEEVSEEIIEVTEVDDEIIDL